MLKLTFAREGAPEYVITVPAAAVKAADDYAKSINLANTEHLMMRFLLDNLLAGLILPRVQHPPDVQEKIDQLQATVAATVAELESERLKPLLPVLEINGQQTTLPAIEAQLAAAREAAKAAPQ